MADDTDYATDLEEEQRQASIKRRKPVPKHNGHCLNCGMEIGRAYCDAECREDAEYFERSKRRNGR